MTDPGDLAYQDANSESVLPDAAPENISSGLGNKGDDAQIKQNEKDEAKVMQTPDPRDER